MSRDHYYIEVVEPRTTWLLELPYKVLVEDEKNIKMLTKLLVDHSEPRFGIVIEILDKLRKDKI